MQDPVCVLPRIPLLGTRVNKASRKFGHLLDLWRWCGRSCGCSGRGGCSGGGGRPPLKGCSGLSSLLRGCRGLSSSLLYGRRGLSRRRALGLLGLRRR
jgi:hypothetical protein